MCFSAEASFGVAVALLPAGAYCVESAWRKDRDYLPLGVVPVLFGLQQLCEGLAWLGLVQGNPETTRVASLGFLFFALAFWPVWIPLAVAAIEPRTRNRKAFFVLAGAGMLFGIVYYLPIASAGGRELNPAVLCHSIRYDFSGVPATRSIGWWIWPNIYLASVAGPLLASHNRLLRPLGLAIVVTAVASYVMFEYAFASVWCFLAALLSVYLAYVLGRRSGPPPIPEPNLLLVPSH